MYLNIKYFQKSLYLLLPFTGIPRVGAFKPHNTYLYSIDNQLDSIESFHLIVSYYKDESYEYKTYEKNVILKCPNLVGCYTSENHFIYIFNIIEWANDVVQFLDGKYSRFSDNAKLTIMKWAGAQDVSRKKLENFTVHIALCPEYYHEDIAKELLYKDDKYIKQCWEMWSKPDVFKETFDEYVLNKEDCENESQLLKEILN